jgi:hypothetical protein
MADAWLGAKTGIERSKLNINELSTAYNAIYAARMSQKFLRHSWLAIAAPFFAASIIRAADSHWKSAAVLFCIGVSLVLVECVVVLRLRIRNPLYRLRNLKTDQVEAVRELDQFQAGVSGFCANIVSSCVAFKDLLSKEEIRLLQGPVSMTNVAERRRFRQKLKREEKDLCELLSEFRGFFYVPD